MNLLSGMEKFGFDMSEELDITADDSKSNKKAATKEKAAPVEHTEKDFIINKKVRCPICDKPFEILAVMTTKIKRLEPDFDLRPNYMYIDTLKYDVVSCPHCGYSSLASTFAKIDSARIKLVRNDFCSSFKPQPEPPMEIYSYEYAIEKAKLALICTMKKRGKMSEKAYLCLKIAWMRRAQMKNFETMEKVDPKIVEDVKKEFDGFYSQAYEGFTKALSTESSPYCGMDASTVEFMLANMAYYYKKYDAASQLVARLIQSPTTNSKLKDKCVDLKQAIMDELKAGK